MSMETLLSNWAPPLLAGILSFFTAWILKSFERNKHYKDKRVESADKTISHFAIYIENWRKVLAIAKFGQEIELDESQKDRLERYVFERDVAKHELSAALATLSLYFGSDVISIAEEFQAWDQGQAIKRIDELPDISEWERHLKLLSSRLKENV